MRELIRPPPFGSFRPTCFKKAREMARTEKVDGDGCSGGEGQVVVEVGVAADGKGLMECRICQQGEEDGVDSPCACSDMIKGWITCEICNEVYSNYVVPPAKCCSDEMDMDHRQSWVGRIDHHDSHFLAIAIAEQQLLQAEFNYCKLLAPNHCFSFDVPFACAPCLLL
ncbi:hypothetical protein ACP70R_006582 [Stipagrostis hirtigluma subsp. patula]